MRRILIAFCFLMFTSLFALSAVRAASAVGEGTSPNGAKNHFFSVNLPTQDQAVQDVMRQCGRYGLQNCRVVATFSNTCAGLIVNHSQRRRGVLQGTDLDRFLPACNARGLACEVVRRVCDTTGEISAKQAELAEQARMAAEAQAKAERERAEREARLAREAREKAERERRQAELEAQRRTQEAEERKRAQQAQREADLPRFKPHVIDSANLLSTATKQELASLVFPPDTPLMIRTVDTLDFTRGPVAADEMMEAEEYWKSVRPRSLWSRWILRDRSESTAIYIVVSRNPPLLQIRYGNRIRFLAFRAGLAAGADYKRVQAIVGTRGLDAAVLSAARWLAEQTARMFEVPWYATGANNVIASYGADLEGYALRASVFSTAVLQAYGKLYVHLLSWFQRLGDWLAQADWLRAITMASTGAVLHWAVKGLAGLTLALVFLFFASRALRMLLLIAAGVVSLLLAIPAIGTLSFLANGRLEDEMYVSALGIVPLSGLVSTDLFSQAPNLFVALLLMGLYLFFGVTKLDYFRYRSLAKLPDYVQQHLESLRNRHELEKAFQTGLLLQAADEREIQQRPYAAWARFALLNTLLAQNPLKLLGALGFFICAPLAISLYVGMICLLGMPVYFARSLYRLASDRKLLRGMQFAR